MNHRMNALQSRDECRKKLAGQKLKFDKAQSLKFKVQGSTAPFRPSVFATFVVL